MAGFALRDFFLVPLLSLESKSRGGLRTPSLPAKEKLFSGSLVGGGIKRGGTYLSLGMGSVARRVAHERGLVWVKHPVEGVRRSCQNSMQQRAARVNRAVMHSPRLKSGKMFLFAKFS